ncbi:hypothetical protein GIB67_032868 [Kingdonia uniflora]|uniref:Uncharacterized protein n=1 Tax=Kingdonia uniflora TaxID=39325 RepID=A0A7J7NCA5_9MAGN|nr:hypothetical protein GIB67_032868 [Kingdonia uniflora]
MAFSLTFKSSSIYVIFALLLLSCFCFNESHGGGEEIVGEEHREFDYFLLALLWPGTICRRIKHCCSSNGCCRSSNSPTEFTIHGLWVDYNDGTWPACCARSKFDVKEISSLLGALEKYWPSLSCSSTSTCFSGKGLFWAHEVWGNHLQLCISFIVP